MTSVGKYRGVKLEGHDFSDQNLRSEDLSGSEFINCIFDRADMSMADCSRSAFIGCKFRQTICYRTNFMNASLGSSEFEPADAFGMTVTLECKTFQNMKTSQQWFYCWLVLATMMLPAKGPVNVDLVDLVIGVIGAERYIRLKNLFARRDI